MWRFYEGDFLLEREQLFIEQGGYLRVAKHSATLKIVPMIFPFEGSV